MLRRVLAGLGLRLVREPAYQKLKKAVGASDDLDFLFALEPDRIIEVMNLMEISRGQLRQDILAMMYSGNKNGGFFVEFGATDGLEKSNTFMLERHFGWKGILAEPNRSWLSALRENRRCVIDERCVWNVDGDHLPFIECADQELATVEAKATRDLHHKSRRPTARYDVPTVTLTTLLKEHSAPDYIDYLSIDTEGSESEIVASFDWTSKRFGFISIEHNRQPGSEAFIDNALESAGYRRVGHSVSKFDAWFVGPTVSEKVLKNDL
ncbi:FkbM family methyltransferase [Luminiphilus sp.]|nr:FkbM family methyltransferase [Luminiphilus sp.]